MSDSADRNHVAGDLGGQYLTCRLAEELYGIEILKVREIIGLLPITPLPHSSEHILGVINLRGRVIPVADLRARFGMPAKEASEETCIIVVEIQDEVEASTMGIVVDEVADVCKIHTSKTAEPPRFDDRIDEQCLLGMGRLGERVIFLLDIAHVLQEPPAVDSLEKEGWRGTVQAPAS